MTRPDVDSMGFSSPVRSSVRLAGAKIPMLYFEALHPRRAM